MVLQIAIRLIKPPDTAGEPLFTRQGCGCYFGFSRFCPFKNDICGEQFVALEVANSIAPIFETSLHVVTACKYGCINQL
jgi:hypothetical protein